LKKPEFGNYELQKRQRTGAGMDLANGHGVEWEYRLMRQRRVVTRRAMVAATRAAVC
jgi:hypothetical protein